MQLEDKLATEAKRADEKVEEAEKLKIENNKLKKSLVEKTDHLDNVPSEKTSQVEEVEKLLSAEHGKVADLTAKCESLNAQLKTKDELIESQKIQTKENVDSSISVEQYCSNL